MAKQDKVQTLSASMIESAMQEQGLTKNDLAKKLDYSYEHVRNFLENETVVPAKHLIEKLAKVLKIDQKELERKALADRLRIKHGDAFLEMQGHIPELEPVERVWPQLSKQHRADLVTMALAFAKQDRYDGA